MNRPFSQVIKSIVGLIWLNLNNAAFSESKGIFQFLLDAEDQMSMKLEAIHECSSYQDIKDINQTLAENSNNSSTLYEALGESIVILNDSAAEGRMSDSEESSGKGHFNEGLDPKTWSIYV
ncbi:hypothetical protein CMV_021610 [Castanea mollissima]|uniref:Uncharacterized protein n=1 Tax=Castanea mollissima TaxID=60419 RepID=A0A8J4VEX1_9ROSI|nr:hypothetical protein CMV_021610 [Castanea mollissima]